MGRKIEADEVVVSEYLKLGMKQRDIAERLGVSRQWVALFAKRNGMSRPKAGRPPRYDYLRVYTMLSEGKDYATIAKEIGAPSATAVRAAMYYKKRKQN
jgi:hypothetical protein